MGFGNYVPFEPKEPPDPTFGELREHMLGYTVECMKCRNRRFLSHKAEKFLRQRLTDDLKVRDATDKFRCSECSHNRVTITPESEWDVVRRMRATAAE